MSAIASLLAAASGPGPAKLAGWGASGGSPLADIGQLALSLLIVVALIFAAAWVFRRLQRIAPGTAAPLRVVGQLALGHKERVVLIEAGDRQLLLGVAPGRVQALHVLEERIEPPAGPAAPGKFSDILGAIRARGGKR